MKRPNPFLISFLASVVTSTLLLSATAANAQPGAGFYAKPVAATASTSLVVRGAMWKCGEAGCFSNGKATSRPAIVCESLVREVGQVSSFRAGTEEFDADALAKCNAKA